jgi:arylsulfatase A-like enzyme
MGHDHDAPRALSPRDLSRAASPAPRFAARVLAWAGAGALAGAAIGSAELALRLGAEGDPSTARRALSLYAHAALFYAAAGALLAPAAALAERLLLRRPVRGLHRAAAAVACLTLAASAFLAAACERRVAEPSAPPSGPPPPPGTPNVVLIVVDTLRADALGCYGAERPTPELDSLAARGVLFEEVVAPSSWTLPSMASLFSGTYPARHGCNDFDGELAPELPHLAEALRQAGFECRAAVGNTLLAAERGFARGFSLYDAYDQALEGRLWLWRGVNAGLRAAGIGPPGKRALVPVLRPDFPFVGTRLTFYNLDRDLADRALRAALPPPADRPLFLYAHFLGPHTPYLEQPPTLLKRARAGTPEERYAALVERTDAEVGRLLAGLERAGVLERAIVCLTADHGEAFGEHGRMEHGYDLHREALRVPWLLAAPALEVGARFPSPVSLVDLAPTLLELAGAPIPPGFGGRSLVPALRGAAPSPAPVFAETSSRFLTPGERHAGAFAGSLRLIAVRDGSGALVSEKLFDLREDPNEQAPLGDHPELAELRRALAAYAESSPAPEPPEGELDLSRMQALGYTDADAGAADPAASSASPP